MIPSPDKKAFFDGIVPQWVLDTEERSARLSDLFAEYDLPARGPVLDIGAGTGILLPHLRKNGSPVVAEMEISLEMLHMAQEQNGLLDDAHFLQADAHRLPFTDGSFATVHCFSVYPHFDDPDLAMSEIRRCLRPGGNLCILHLMGHEQLNDLHREAGHAVKHDILPPVDVLARTVEQRGFRIEHTEERDDLYLLLAKRNTVEEERRVFQS